MIKRGLFFTFLLILSLIGSQVWAVKCQEVFNTLQVAGMPGLNSQPHFPVGYGLESFPEGTGARIYAELAVQNRHMNQAANELEALGLIVEKGGLCASACITNVVSSLVAQSGNYVALRQLAPQVTELLILKYRDLYNLDARMGADVGLMSDVITSFLPEILQSFRFDNFHQEINLSVAKMTKEFFPYRLYSLMRGDSIAIATVAPVGRVGVGHAIVILKVDLENSKLIISDPNNPNQILAVPYTYSRGTDVTFRVPFTYGDQLVEFRQINAFSRTFYSVF